MAVIVVLSCFLHLLGNSKQIRQARDDSQNATCEAVDDHGIAIGIHFDQLDHLGLEKLEAIEIGGLQLITNKRTDFALREAIETETTGKRCAGRFERWLCQSLGQAFASDEKPRR